LESLCESLVLIETEFLKTCFSLIANEGLNIDDDFEQYIQYSKLKRIINRRKFIADRDEANAEAASKSVGRIPSLPTLNSASTTSKLQNEYSPIQASLSGKSLNTYTDESNGVSGIQMVDGFMEDESDFFKVILSEIEKVNKFFVG
jgi:hypothetical protein